jgi:hypothetical protein
MPAGRILLCLILCSGLAAAQSPEAMKYAPRAIALLSGQSGVENVMPLVFTENGQQYLEFVPSSGIKEAFARGGKPILFGDLLTVLKEATDKIDQLQAENDRLWKWQ